LKDATRPDAHGASDAVGTTAVRNCAYKCTTDDDCVAGQDTSKKCDSVKKRCIDPTTACKTNDDCTALASFWLVDCVTDDDCVGDVCIDVAGHGLCARVPALVVGGVCFSGGPLLRRRFGGDGATVTVCGSESGRCRGGSCTIGCVNDSFCTDDATGMGYTCNTTTALCECSTNSDCYATGVSTCNTASHSCECARNDDCTQEGKDLCVAGTCGCSSADTCPASPYANAPPVCE
jgi:hypothetical protein